MTKNAKNNVNGEFIDNATGSWIANGRFPTAKKPKEPPMVITDASKPMPNNASCQFSIFFTFSGRIL